MKKLMTLMMALVLMMTALAGCSSSSSDKVQLKILDTEYITEEYAIALSKENTDLLGKMDQALTELKADGTLQTIVDKYISGKAHDLVFQQNAEGKEELVMATDAAFPPYEYYEGEVIVGIDAEIAAAIADKLDMKLEAFLSMNSGCCRQRMSRNSFIRPRTCREKISHFLISSITMTVSMPTRAR